METAGRVVTEEARNTFPFGLVFDDQMFGLSIVASGRLEGDCENYAVVPLFFLYFSLFIARPPVLSTTLNCIIMLSRLLRQHVARAYGQDTLYWL